VCRQEQLRVAGAASKNRRGRAMADSMAPTSRMPAAPTYAVNPYPWAGEPARAPSQARAAPPHTATRRHADIEPHLDLYVIPSRASSCRVTPGGPLACLRHKALHQHMRERYMRLLRDVLIEANEFERYFDGVVPATLWRAQRNPEPGDVFALIRNPPFHRRETSGQLTSRFKTHRMDRSGSGGAKSARREHL
jgi:hypothetical protein